MNLIHIAGHLGADPESRFTPSGQKVTTLRVAARVRRGGQDKTIWWKVTLWGDQFDKMLTFFKKGSSIMVVGELNEPEIFTNKEGNPQISMSMTAIHLMFSPFGRSDKPAHESAFSASEQEPVVSFAQSTQSGTAPIDDSSSLDDEIPF